MEGFSICFLLMLIEVGEYPFKATKAIDRIVVSFFDILLATSLDEIGIAFMFFLS